MFPSGPVLREGESQRRMCQLDRDDTPFHPNQAPDWRFRKARREGSRRFLNDARIGGVQRDDDAREISSRLLHAAITEIEAEEVMRIDRVAGDATKAAQPRVVGGRRFRARAAMR